MPKKNVKAKKSVNSSTFKINPNGLRKTKKLSTARFNGTFWGKTLIASHQEFLEIFKGIKSELHKWQKDKLQDLYSKEQGLAYSFPHAKGETTLLVLPPSDPDEGHMGLTRESEYAQAKDFFGAWALGTPCKQKELLLAPGLSQEQCQGIGTGLEVASYSFNLTGHSQDKGLSFDQVKTATKHQLSHLTEGMIKGEGVNIARYLVDTPAERKTPESYAKAVAALAKTWGKDWKVVIWNEKKLREEKMGMILGVGSGSVEGPCLVKLAYRPKKALNKKSGTYAFVGKGITFDTGGLNLKPTGGMRNMKKDMGGSAGLVGLASWMANSDCPFNADIYLALAENSVHAESFRPGDILTSRKGLTVEIHNTDAEGRLALGDALDVATNLPQKERPALVIDCATLTGAVKVGLGVEYAGLFSTQDELAMELLEAGAKAGDKLWRLPLVKSHQKAFKGTISDLVNAVNGWGGAINAAMFLQHFVHPQVPWAHIDLYAWADGPKGPLRGGQSNGQSVLALAKWFENKSEQLQGDD